MIEDNVTFTDFYASEHFYKNFMNIHIIVLSIPWVMKM
jgi:hypothetical protein